MTSATLDRSAIFSRAAEGREIERSKITSLNTAYFKATASALGIATAFSIEMFTLTTALHAKFQALSDGDDLGSHLMPIRYGIGGVLLLAHAMQLDHPNDTTSRLRRLLRRFRYVPIVAIMAGMALFMFTATAQATSGDDGQGGGLSGIGLGVVCGALFSVSFLASTKLMGVLLPAVRTILVGWAQRSILKGIDRDLDAAEQCRAQIAKLQHDIAERQKPDALRSKAAEEAAAVVGQVAADAHGIHALHDALTGEDIRPQDVVDLPDAPLGALDQRQAYLKTLNVQFFLDLLNQKGHLNHA